MSLYPPRRTGASEQRAVRHRSAASLARAGGRFVARRGRTADSIMDRASPLFLPAAGEPVQHPGDYPDDQQPQPREDEPRHYPGYHLPRDREQPEAGRPLGQTRQLQRHIVSFAEEDQDNSVDYTRS